MWCLSTSFHRFLMFKKIIIIMMMMMMMMMMVVMVKVLVMARTAALMTWFAKHKQEQPPWFTPTLSLFYFRLKIPEFQTFRRFSPDSPSPSWSVCEVDFCLLSPSPIQHWEWAWILARHLAILPAACEERNKPTNCRPGPSSKFLAGPQGIIGMGCLIGWRGKKGPLRKLLMSKNAVPRYIL